jgi:hypothetical protein
MRFSHLAACQSVYDRYPSGGWQWQASGPDRIAHLRVRSAPRRRTQPFETEQAAFLSVEVVARAVLAVQTVPCGFEQLNAVPDSRE